jgi:hypothetical protein
VPGNEAVFSSSYRNGKRSAWTPVIERLKKEPRLEDADWLPLYHHQKYPHDLDGSHWARAFAKSEYVGILRTVPASAEAGEARVAVLVGVIPV